MLARSRFKNTKDLWLYLTERRKYLTRSKIFHFHVFTALKSNSNPTRIGLAKLLLIFLFFAVGYLLPAFKATRLQHIQDILAGRKLALLQKDVPARHMPHWPELSVKTIHP